MAKKSIATIAKKEGEPVIAPLIWLFVLGVLLIFAGIYLVLFIHPVAGISCIVIGSIMVVLYFVLREPLSKK